MFKNPLSQKRIDARIEIAVSHDDRINGMALDSRLAVQAALLERYTDVIITFLDDLADLQKLVTRKPDLVVLGMRIVPVDASLKLRDTSKVWLSAYLHENGIAYTGSDKPALVMQYDKHVAKQKVIDAGLNSSKFFLSKKAAPSSKHNLSFPLFVKPNSRGGSKGIDSQSLVHSQEQLNAKLDYIHTIISSDVIIEEYLPGREFSVAVVGRPGTDNLVALPVEIVVPANENGDSFLSKAVKKADSEEVVAIDDAGLKDRLSLLAIEVFQTLGSRDYGRIDLRLDAQGTPHFIEANLTPGLSNHGYLSKCFKLNGNFSYNDMITSIVGLGYERVPQV